MTIADADLEERFAALGPWFTQCTIDGATYGGANSYDGDGSRAHLFCEYMGTSPSG